MFFKRFTLILSLLLPFPTFIGAMEQASGKDSSTTAQAADGSKLMQHCGQRILASAGKIGAKEDNVPTNKAEEPKDAASFFKKYGRGLVLFSDEISVELLSPALCYQLGALLKEPCSLVLVSASMVQAAINNISFFHKFLEAWDIYAFENKVFLFIPKIMQSHAGGKNDHLGINLSCFSRVEDLLKQYPKTATSFIKRLATYCYNAATGKHDLMRACKALLIAAEKDPLTCELPWTILADGHGGSVGGYNQVAGMSAYHLRSFLDYLDGQIKPKFFGYHSCYSARKTNLVDLYAQRNKAQSGKSGVTAYDDGHPQTTYTFPIVCFGLANAVSNFGVEYRTYDGYSSDMNVRQFMLKMQALSSPLSREQQHALKSALYDLVALSRLSNVSNIPQIRWPAGDVFKLCSSATVQLAQSAEVADKKTARMRYILDQPFIDEDSVTLTVDNKIPDILIASGSPLFTQHYISEFNIPQIKQPQDLLICFCGLTKAENSDKKVYGIKKFTCDNGTKTVDNVIILQRSLLPKFNRDLDQMYFEHDGASFLASVDMRAFPDNFDAYDSTCKAIRIERLSDRNSAFYKNLAQTTYENALKSAQSRAHDAPTCWSRHQLAHPARNTALITCTMLMFLALLYRMFFYRAANPLQS